MGNGRSVHNKKRRQSDGGAAAADSVAAAISGPGGSTDGSPSSGHPVSSPTTHGPVLSPAGITTVLWGQRFAPEAARFKVRGPKKGSELTKNAWTNLFLELPTVEKGQRQNFYAHYSTNKSSVQNKKKTWRKTASFSPGKRGGRASFMKTPAYLDAVRTANQDRRGQGVARQAVAIPLPGGMYRGVQAAHPCAQSVSVAKKQVRYKRTGVKLRPAIKPAGREHRVGISKLIVQEAPRQHRNFDVDEKWFTLPRLKYADKHPESDIEDAEHHQTFFKVVSHKSHIPKVMVVAWITKPIINKNWTCKANKWKTTGLCHIARCTKMVVMKNGKKAYDLDGKPVRERRINPASGRLKLYDVYEVEAGRLKEVDCAMDGAMYRDKSIEAARKIRAYNIAAGYTGQSEVQEDGAPGHGYNNKAANEDGMPGKGTTTHEEMEIALLESGICIFKQAASSPEQNGLDLGFWFMQDAAVQRRYKEFEPYFNSKDKLLDKLYEVIEEEFWAIPPEKIYSIFEHKIDICKQIIKEKGYKLKKECHGGARKRTRDAINAKKAGAAPAHSGSESSDSE